jgi:hypothetical protein
MLRHLGEAAPADLVEGAVLATLESGTAMTADLARQAGADIEEAVSTTAFTDAVITNLGRSPTVAIGRGTVSAGTVPAGSPPEPRSRWSYEPAAYERMERDLVGLDVVVESDLPADELGAVFSRLAGEPFRLEFVEARGTVVYPPTGLASDPVRAFRARFVGTDGRRVGEGDLVALLGRVSERLRWSEAIRLQRIDGEPAFTLAQGQ